MISGIGSENFHFPQRNNDGLCSHMNYIEYHRLDEEKPAAVLRCGEYQDFSTPGAWFVPFSSDIELLMISGIGNDNFPVADPSFKICEHNIILHYRAVRSHLPSQQGFAVMRCFECDDVFQMPNVWFIPDNGLIVLRDVK